MLVSFAIRFALSCMWSRSRCCGACHNILIFGILAYAKSALNRDETLNTCGKETARNTVKIDETSAVLHKVFCDHARAQVKEILHSEKPWYFEGVWDEIYFSIPPHMGQSVGNFLWLHISWYEHRKQRQVWHLGQCLKPPPIILPQASQGLDKSTIKLT